MSIKKYSSGSWVTVPYRKYETATDTITSLPKTIIGDGTALSAWSMKGNMTQSGTPTPSNPIYPTECGDKTANLFDYADLEDGTLSNGEPVPYTGHKRTAHFINVEASTTYRLSNINGSERVSYYDSTKSYLSNALIENTFSTPNNCAYVKFSGSATGWTQTTMLTKGSTAPSTFIPFGYEIPISFGQGTYTNYLSEPIRKIGTAVDSMASTGTATRNFVKWVLTGNETVGEYDASTKRLFVQKPDFITLGNRITPMICSHFQGIYDGRAYADVPNNSVYSGSSGDYGVYINETDWTSAASFKTWLATQYANNAPVTIWYQLATPTTETFTAPSIPTTGTAESFDVSTTLKPSEVSLTYHGWHEHSDTKYTNP